MGVKGWWGSRDDQSLGMVRQRDGGGLVKVGYRVGGQGVVAMMS